MGVQNSCCKTGHQLLADVDMGQDLQRGAADASKVDLIVASSKNSNVAQSPGRKNPQSVEDMVPHDTQLKTVNVEEQEHTPILPFKSLEEEYLMRNEPIEIITTKEEGKKAEKSPLPFIFIPPGVVPLKEVPNITHFRVREMLSKMRDIKLPEYLDIKYKTTEFIKLGPVMFPNNDVYVGQWKKNEAEGIGVKLFADGSLYYGEFKRNQANGFGLHLSEEGNIYHGNWENGLCEGLGEFLAFKGSLYIGSWRKNKKHGKGREVWPDGTIYEGEYDEGRLEGSGKMIWPSNCTYQGEFKNGLMDGVGIYVWPTVEDRLLKTSNDPQKLKASGQNRIKMYDGDWKEGFMDGYGIMVWPDGRKYEGSWCRGKRYGEGTYIQPNEQLKASVPVNEKENLVFKGRFGKNKFFGNLIKGAISKVIDWQKGTFKKNSQFDKDFKELKKFESANK